MKHATVIEPNAEDRIWLNGVRAQFEELLATELQHRSASGLTKLQIESVLECVEIHIWWMVRKKRQSILWRAWRYLWRKT